MPKKQIKKPKYSYQGKFNPNKLVPDNIDRLSIQMIPNNQKILELGCATGFMSQYLKQVKNCQIYGVDLDPASIKLAKPHLKKARVGDLDQESTWKQIYQDKPYDVVFASAVIEHLKNPWDIISKIHSNLKKDGLLVITTPNIAHWRMRVHLLRGKFEYTQYGILDNTHTKFFTYFTFQDLITQAGFEITNIQIDPAGGIKYFNPIAKHFPNFYAHQIAIQARKR